MCTPNLKDYAGEEIIQRSKIGNEFFLDHSYVEYDLDSKKVMTLHFVMRYGVLGRVRELLEIKYGKAQKDSRFPGISYWYGDKNGDAFIYLSESEPRPIFLGSPATEGKTDLVISSSAMAKVRAGVEARKLRAIQDKKTNALKAL